MASPAHNIDFALAVARRQYDAGHFQNAEGLYRQLLAVPPDDAAALNSLGASLYRVRRHELALEFFKASVSIEDNNPEIHNNIAAVLVEVGHLDSALSHFHKALSLRADYPEAQLGIGIVLRRQGKVEQAVARFQTVVALKPDRPEALSDLADMLCELNRLDEAIVHYQRAAALRPDLAAMLIKLGSALLRRNNIDGAIGSYQKALIVEPVNAIACNGLGVALARQLKFSDAIVQYRRAVAIKPDFEVLSNLGAALAEQKKFSEAEQTFSQALELNSGHAQTHYNLAVVSAHQRKFDAAVSQFRRALALKADYVEAGIGLGLMLVELGKVAEAIAEAEKVSQFKSWPLFPHFTYGTLLARCGLSDAARGSFDAYLEQDPQDRLGARMFLAGLGFEPLPERVPDELLHDLYTRRAAYWDQGVSAASSYRGAELVANRLASLAEGERSLDITDVGCGTGLVGSLVRAKARRLVGVDISAAMLERAREKQTYDRLEQGDLVEFLHKHPASCDVVTSAATLLHFGDLRPPFAAAVTALRSDGLFIFTLFPNEADPHAVAVGSFDGLVQGGCFIHGRDYIIRVAEVAGFVVESMDDEVHEYAGEKPRMGIVIALRRRMTDRPVA